MYTWPLYRFAKSLRSQPSWSCEVGAAAAVEAVVRLHGLRTPAQAGGGAGETGVGWKCRCCRKRAIAEPTRGRLHRGVAPEVERKREGGVYQGSVGCTSTPLTRSDRWKNERCRQAWRHNSVSVNAVRSASASTNITCSAQAATTTSTDRRTLTSRRSGCTWHKMSSGNHQRYCRYFSCTTGILEALSRGGGCRDARCAPCRHPLTELLVKLWVVVIS